ncbi:MAG TPA: G1 family glutamic endopeptidase [Candidatus Microsaccharimonas sp.]|jgi:hypothetical protein
MAQSRNKKQKHSAGFIARTRLIISAVGFVIVAGGFTAYALYTLQPKVTPVVAPVITQPSDSDKVTGTAPSTPLPTKTPTVVVPKPVAPTPVVTTPPPSAPVTPPSTGTDVPTLTPTTGQTGSTTYQSTNWAGYLATGGNFTTVSGTWVTPNPTATSSSVESGDGTWIGIGGVSTSDLIQVGTENTISASGVVTTAGFYELLPASAQGTPTLTIQPGDTISASITQTAATQWTITMTDVTSGQTFSTSVSYTSSLSSAEWIQEDPSYVNGSLVLLDNFGTVPFSGATATKDGTTLTAAVLGASSIAMVGQGGATGHGGTPSALNGGSFSVSYF